MKAIFVAGGTGGHVYPALEVAREVKKEGGEIHWIGRDNSLEKQISAKEGFCFKPIRSKGFRNKKLIEKISSIYYLFSSLIISIYILKKIKPDFIFCCGGYITLGPGIASFILRIPLFIHEQNSVAGTANKILATFTKKTFAGFPSSFPDNKKIKFVGNPVRQEIISSEKLVIKDTSNKEFCLLVLGGSQGSEQLNSIVMKALTIINDLKDWKITHQSGSFDKQRLENFYSQANADYTVEPFIEDMGKAYLNADLVVARAGAMTISELIITCKPSILLPLPWATDNHQFLNAKYLHDLGSAEIVISQEENALDLANLLSELNKNEEKRLSMSNSAKLGYPPQVAKNIFNQINESLEQQTK